MPVRKPKKTLPCFAISDDLNKPLIYVSKDGISNLLETTK